MSEQKIMVYKCPFTGKEIPGDDKRLIGLGNPPRSPFQPVGTGTTPMPCVGFKEETKTKDKK